MKTFNFEVKNERQLSASSHVLKPITFYLYARRRSNNIILRAELDPYRSENGTTSRLHFVACVMRVSL